MTIRNENKMRAQKRIALLFVLSMMASQAIAEEAPVLQPMTGTVVAAESTDTPDETVTSEPTATPKATATPAPTEISKEDVSPYDVTFSVPSGWTNSEQVSVSLRVTDPGNLGWKKIQYQMGGGWKNISDALAATGKTTLTVSENGTLTVHITDPHGHVFEESAEINVFDRTAPTVKARTSGGKLKVTVRDSQSGVGGVQVNGMLFTELDGDTLSIRLGKDFASYQHLAVRAFDFTGNFSEPNMLDNPVYEEPEEAKATPTPTPKASASAVTASPNQSASSAGTAIYMQTSVSSASNVPTASPIVVYATPQPSATPIIQKEYITLGPGMPYQQDGNSHTLDMLYSAATNKQFITLQTKSGNTFYLVIDYDKPVDEDAELYETYFLNLVDERDLYDLIGEKDMPTPSPTPQIIYASPVPTAVPTAVPVAETEPKKDTSQAAALAALFALLAIGGAAGFLYLKNKAEKKKRMPTADFDLDGDDDDEDEENDEP